MDKDNYSDFTFGELVSEITRLGNELKAMEHVKETERDLRLQFENELKRIVKEKNNA